ncbi:TIGR01777 family oxidoreductase [Flagellimonas flava]|uniref:TIGR01777 family oxidoreductase n=1 Tax=Flagellimonas flava TaxID=570519 RepID=UPI003D65C61E
MKKIILAGGSGFLGSILQEYFKDKCQQIIVLSRKSYVEKDNIRFMEWDGISLGTWAVELENADAVINLSGRSVDCRYTQKNREAIFSSRLLSTKAIGTAIHQCVSPPKVWLNSSTATIYRHSLDKQMDEFEGEIGSGFSVNVAQAWERSLFSFRTPNTRKVAMRTSIVFGKRGGAFIPILNLAKVGFGGKQGIGNQFVSWIHETDFARSVQYLLNNPELSNSVNLVSPIPVTNKLLMQTIRQKLGIPLGVPLGKLPLEIGARIIKTETELILKSRNVIPKKLQIAGFEFQYPNIESCLTDLLSKS